MSVKSFSSLGSFLNTKPTKGAITNENSVRTVEFLDVETRIKVLYFNVSISVDGHGWVFSKTFEDFFNLNAELRDRFPSISILNYFPSSRLGKDPSEAALRRRREVLEAFMRIVVSHPVLWFTDIVQTFVDSSDSALSMMEERSVRIMKIEKFGNDVLYHLRVRYGRAEWMTAATYSELRYYANRLRRRYPQISSIQYFPRDVLFGGSLTEDFIERRRQLLQAWLTLAVHNPLLWNSDLTSVALNVSEGLENDRIGKRKVYIEGTIFLSGFFDTLAFNVVVEKPTGAHYAVVRRFSQFEDLSDELKHHYRGAKGLEIVEYFPRGLSWWSGKDPAEISRLQNLLDMYIRVVASKAVLWKSDAFQMFILDGGEDEHGPGRPEEAPLLNVAAGNNIDGRESIYNLSVRSGMSGGIVGGGTGTSGGGGGGGGAGGGVSGATRVALPPRAPPEPARDVLANVCAELDLAIIAGTNVAGAKSLVSQFNALLGQFPNHTTSLINGSVAFGLLGDAQETSGNSDEAFTNYSKALDLLERALLLRPDAPEVLTNMGVLLCKLAKVTESGSDRVEGYKKAMKTLKAVASDRPDNHTADLFFSTASLSLAALLEAGQPKNKCIDIALNKFIELAEMPLPEPSFLYRWSALFSTLAATLDTKDREAYEKFAAKARRVAAAVNDAFCTVAQEEMSQTPAAHFSKWADFVTVSANFAESRTVAKDLAARAAELSSIASFIETPGCTFVHVGFLHKRGAKVKNWKRRWFVLSMDGSSLTLNYFVEIPKAGKKQAEAKGTVELKDVSECSELVDPGLEEKLSVERGSCFKICTADRVFELAANTRLEREGWVLAINRAVKPNSVMAANTPDFQLVSPDYLIIHVEDI